MAESIGVVYGSALSQLSFEEGCEEQVYLQMQDLNEIFVQNEEFMNLLCAPVISTEEKSQLIDRVFGGQVLPVVLNFLKVLAENGRFSAFDQVALEVKRMYLEHKGIKEVLVTSAKPLEDSQMQRLKAAMVEKLGTEVLIVQKVDETLMGGLSVEFDGKRADASIAARLRQLENTIKEGV